MHALTNRPAVTSAPSPAIVGWMAFYEGSAVDPEPYSLDTSDYATEEAKNEEVPCVPVAQFEARDKRLQCTATPGVYLDHRVNNAARLAKGAESRSQTYGLDLSEPENRQNGPWEDFDPSVRYAVVGQHADGGDMAAYVLPQETPELAAEDIESELWNASQVPSEVWDLDTGEVAVIARTFTQQPFTTPTTTEA